MPQAAAAFFLRNLRASLGTQICDISIAYVSQGPAPDRNRWQMLRDGIDGNKSQIANRFNRFVIVKYCGIFYENIWRILNK